MRPRLTVIFLATCLLSFSVGADDAPQKLSLKLTIEHPDGAPALKDAPIRMLYERPIRAVGNEPPNGEMAKLVEGANSVDLSTFPDGKHYFYLSRAGCASQWIHVTVKNGECSCNRNDIMLFRTRYAIIRFAWNTKGERALTGDDVKSDRVALAHWSNLPNFGHDWQLWQGDGSGTSAFGETLELSFHRVGGDWGFAEPPGGTTFDDLAEAPDPATTTYRCISRPATAGLVLFCHVKGAKSGNEYLGFGKIEIQEITFTPPKDVQVIERK